MDDRETIKQKQLKRENEVSYRTLAENLPGVVYRVFLRENYRMQFFNDMLEQLTGFRPEELIHGEVCSIDPLIYPEDRDRVLHAVKHAMAQDVPFEIEYRLIHKNGTLRHLLERGRPIRGADGQPLFIDGVIIDITERRQSEEALRESEARLNLAQKAANAGIWDWNIHTGELVWNDECYRLFGQSPETCMPSYETWLQALYPNDREACLTSVSQAIEKNQELALEYRVIHPDGSVHWLNSIGQTIYDSAGRPKSMMGICLDITARKAAEEVLRSSHEELERRVKERTTEIQRVNERLRQEIEVRRQAEEALERERRRLLALLEALPTYIALIELDFSVVYANREFRTRFGEVDGRRCHEILFGRQEPCEDCPIFRVLETQLPLELERLGPDGRVYQTYNYPFSDVDGSPLVLKMGLDITERKRAQEALQKSEARLAEAQRIAHMGHWEWIIPTNEIVWSHETYRIFQLALHQFEASFEGFLSHVYPDDKKIVQDNVAEALAGKKPYSIDHRIVLPDGAISWVHEEGEVSFDAAGKPVRMLGTVQDLTKIRQTEEALRESEQRLRYLTSQLLTAYETERRRIAVGLHDELGQALMILKFQLSTIKDKLWADKSALSIDCENLLHYLDGLIDKVRQFSRDLNAPNLLEELGFCNSLKYLIDGFCKHYDIQQSCVDIEEINHILSKEAQVNIYRIFQEALTNIVRHAQATRIFVEIKKMDAYVSFKIQDDGKGFDVKQVLRRKTVNSGIGISAMQERVKILRGSIDIWSQAGSGTRITFHIPQDG